MKTNDTIENIQDKLFMLNDKIKWAEMFIAHAKADIHELQEYLFDVEEKMFESNLKKLIDLAVKFSKDIMFIGPVLGNDSILKPLPGGMEDEDWSYDRKRTGNYNNILKNIVVSRNCKLIQLLDKLNSEDFEDGLHPNEQGHRKMFEIIKQYF